jgi:hypothetical protein
MLICSRIESEMNEIRTQYHISLCSRNELTYLDVRIFYCLNGEGDIKQQYVYIYLLRMPISIWGKEIG